jgi:DNA-directed RNA polymerase sigma subunit (sigma70/sigma32)
MEDDLKIIKNYLHKLMDIKGKEIHKLKKDKKFHEKYILNQMAEMSRLNSKINKLNNFFKELLTDTEWFRQLEFRERQILNFRNGWGEHEKPLTYFEIAELLSISCERVRQIESKAYAKLKMFGI